VDRFDVHAHFVPDFYADALVAAGHSRPDGMPAIPAWTETDALATMDRLGVRKALLSISSPGVHFGDDSAARLLARRVNDEAHALRRAHPDRFGSFAALPLPDVDGAVSEAIHAIDHLGAEGVVLQSHHHGLYLGDPRLDPLYRELDRRRKIVFVHPTSPACSCCPRLAVTYPRPMLEFMFETTRSVTDMVLGGVLKRFPGLKVIVPHAGAVLPTLLNRIELVSALVRASDGGPAPSMREAVRGLYFDLAGAPVPHMLGALLDVADHKRILYGSDYPFTPAAGCEVLLRLLEDTRLLDGPLRDMVLRDNAAALFPVAESR
jgi:predicted TIM-barrel fold metal-dependent hydrolase